ncbi:peptidylprolyl isomerase [Dokdonella fugitiva]|jgi:peptidyl-prolyl cis-trans isomerase SurA|uniref:Chaperone SurA n=1 Tax=Dokdonella fugitiva TaxID=328517 RepID=A0A4R2IE94_9GAMM|nr:peptidylprolyl isomerase [Dokdonella fugitiva]MBA8885001.1 peptidyl-prolyl cis-trans isomerase SurA [Dokdonella fugitiva]TCO42099.1 peptidyl-prolyl cis-trans isomerase SurA [Dokdonella fugitiva]
MKRTLPGLALAFALLTPFATPAFAQAVASEPIDRIVAVVDEDVVLQSELDRQVAAVTAQFANNPQQLPPHDVLERQLLDRLIMQKLQVARADSTGVKVSDAQIDQALGTIAQQNRMDVSQLRVAIERQGMSYDGFRDNVREQLIMQQLRQRVAQSRVQVSDAEVDSLIRNGNLHPGQMHIGYIMINVPDGATPEQVDEARAKADDVKKQIDEGMDFAAAAIRYSNAENALQGGDLGWRSANELPPAMVDAADKMQEGEVSRPIRGANGFHIIKLIGKRDTATHMVTEYEASHILVKTSELVTNEQAEKKINEIRARVVGGEDFAKVAKETSDDEQTAGLGGDLGWFVGEAYGTSIANTVKDMKPGDISQPFQTNAGWHILKLVDVRETDKAGEMQRDEAKNMLFGRKAEDEYASFLRQLRSEAFIEIRLPGAAGGTNGG